jgi:hypothetical protein
MFGKPKKRAKAVAQSATPEEAAKVMKALGKKYPDMMAKTGAWGKPKKTAVAKIKQAVDDADASLREALTPEEIKKLRGK